MAPKRKQQLDLTCHICGDSAIGVNFQVPSCMSCKVFYRRNAKRSDKVFKCEFSNSCTINVITRKFCSSCRIDKCLKMGMKPEYICSGKPRKQKTPKEAKSSLNSKTNLDINSSDSNTQIDDAEFSESLSESSDEAYFSMPSDLSDDYLLQELGTLSNYLQSSPDSDFDFDIDLEPIDILSSVNNPLSSEAVTTTDYFTTFLTTPQTELPQTDPLIESLSAIQPHQIAPLFTSIGFPVRELVFSEKCLLKELSSACSVLQNPYRTLRHFSAEDSPLNISLISEHFFHRLVQMCSRLDGFRTLDPVNQKTMLKCSLLEMTAIRSILMYSADRKAWLTVDDVNKATAIVPMSLFRPFCLVHSYLRHQALPGRFRSEWKRDEHIFDLLTVLVLFTSRLEYAKADQIAGQYNCYSRLLFRYCSVKYATSSEAEESYRLLLEGVQEMRTLNVDVVNFYREYKEIFKGSPVFDALLDLNESSSSSATIEDKNAKKERKEGNFRLSKSNLQMDNLLAVVC